MVKIFCYGAEPVSYTHLFALIAGVIAACAARPAVFQRSRRWDFLLGQHTLIDRTAHQELETRIAAVAHVGKVLVRKQLRQHGRHGRHARLVNSCTSYMPQDFGDEEQINLANFCKGIGCLLYTSYIQLFISGFKPKTDSFR